MNSTECVAWIGIDWADAEHAVCLLPREGEPLESRIVPQQAEELDAWADELRRRFEGRPVGVCVEQSRGALFYALLKYDFLVLFPINPKQLARYREAFTPSGAKDDPTDAELLARFLREHHGRLRAWQPDDVLTRKLRLLSEDRRRWVDQRTAVSNRLQQRLKEFYPWALNELGTVVHAEANLAFLAKFPSPAELRRASPRQFQRWFPRRREEPLATLRRLRQAPPLVTDEAVLLAGRLEIVHAVAELQQLNRAIADYDRQIAALLAQHPDAQLIGSFPGVGRALAPRLLAALGDRQAGNSAEALQAYSGVAPVLLRSGKSAVVRRRRACPHFVRQTFHEFARCSLRGSAWARAFYRMLRAKGAGHHAAIRALAFKWIRILVRCWQDRKPYDEQRYLQQLRNKKAPLLAFLENPAPLPSNT